MRVVVWLVAVTAACHSSHATSHPPDAPEACVSVATCADPQFPIAVSDIGAPGRWDGLAFADFDGDGVKDVAVATGTASVTVMKGIGHRRFGSPMVFGTGGNPSRVAEGDMDNDGDPDLVVAAPDDASGSGTIRVLLNDGSGLFAQGASIDIQTTDLALGDLDGNGSLDIAIVDNGNVSVFYNAGDATFGPRVDYAVDAGGIVPSIADLDGDGALDLVTATGSGQIAVMLRRGSGYATTTSTATSGNVLSLALGDFDGDHHTDVAVSYWSPTAWTARVFANDGSGGLTSLAPTAMPDGAMIHSAADLVGDSKADLLVEADPAFRTDGYVGVLEGEGSGAFTPVWSGTAMNAFMSLVDLDGDGKLDLAYALGAELSTLAGRGDGTFVTALPLPGPLAPSDSLLDRLPTALGDVTGDGKPDIVRGGPDVELLRNLGDHFADPVQVSASTAGSVALSDLDGDGRLDIISINRASMLNIFLNTPTGFVAAASVMTDANPWEIAVGDLDNDRKPDIIIACTGFAPPSPGAPSVPGALDVFHNDGGGAFTLSLHLDGSYAHVFAGDVDLDGNVDVFTDLAAANGSAGGAELLRGTGAGTFAAPIALPGGSYRLMDLDNDGVPDELSGGEGNMMFAFGRGDGTYGAPIAVVPAVLAIGDLDGDCIPDVIATDGNSQLWEHGNGDGTFDARSHFDSEGRIVRAITDLDGDGHADLQLGADKVDYLPCAP